MPSEGGGVSSKLEARMRTPGGYRRAAGACLNLAQEYDETSTKRELAEISISRSVRNQSLRQNDADI